ncbi:MAG TPA: carbohydrate-binding family 9-like protein [Polyangiaceae bacterium]
MRRALLGATLAALSALACSRSPRVDQRGLVLDALPAQLPLELDLELGDAVELLGGKVEPASDLKQGSRVELTLYWRKRARVEKGFRLFTHVLDEAGERLLTLDGIGPLRGPLGKPTLPPSAWEEGKVYVDQQAFTVPYTLRTDSISIVTGMFRGDERLPVTRGKRDMRGKRERLPGDRGLVAKLAVQRATPNKSVPLLWLPRRKASEPLVIDGKLDEPAWTFAASTGSFVNVATGEAPTGAELAASAKLLFDDEALYIGFEVQDEDLRGGFDTQAPDPHLWTRDTVEVMIDPSGDGDNRDYYEIQVGPQNLVFDSQFDDYNQPRLEPDGPFGHQEWSSRLRSAVVLRGTLDDEREDEGYVVEMAIPWSSFDKAKRSPPRAEDIWRMNFYAMQNNGGVAWSPILRQGNFHLGSRFGRIRFAAPQPSPRSLNSGAP